MVIDYTDIDLTKFIKELQGKVYYEEHTEIITKKNGKKKGRTIGKHFLGTKILSNQDVGNMLANHYGSDYSLLPSGEKTKLREEVFRQLRRK